LGWGVWGAGFGAWPHTPQPPTPNPQSPIPKKFMQIILFTNYFLKIKTLDLIFFFIF